MGKSFYLRIFYEKRFCNFERDEKGMKEEKINKKMRKFTICRTIWTYFNFFYNISGLNLILSRSIRMMKSLCILLYLRKGQRIFAKKYTGKCFQSDCLQIYDYPVYFFFIFFQKFLSKKSLNFASELETLDAFHNPCESEINVLWNKLIFLFFLELTLYIAWLKKKKEFI